MAPSSHFISLIGIAVTLTSILGSARGRPTTTSIDTNESPLPIGPKSENPSILELFKNFDVTELIPDSAFQRFLVHSGRVLVVALIVVLWFLMSIQAYVWAGKCLTFLWECHHKEETTGEDQVPSSEVKGKEKGNGDYQQNYMNRIHSMPILIFKK